jgi:hypothetical protein
MVLQRDVGNILRYMPEAVDDLEDLGPDYIVTMLHDIRDDISEFNPDLRGMRLRRVLKIVRNGSYTVRNGREIKIDLAQAKEIIDGYDRDLKHGKRSLTVEAMVVGT